MILRAMSLAACIAASISMTGCKTFPSGDMAPAALMSEDDSSMSALKAAAAEILGRQTVQLGASDFKNSPAVSVLPERSGAVAGAPFSQQDFAIPTTLLIMTDGKNCFLVKEDTRDFAHLAGIDCRALQGISAP